MWSNASIVGLQFRGMLRRRKKRGLVYSRTNCPSVPGTPCDVPELLRKEQRDTSEVAATERGFNPPPSVKTGETSISTPVKPTEAGK